MAPGPSAIPAAVCSLCADGVIQGCHALLEAPFAHGVETTCQGTALQAGHLPRDTSSWPCGTASPPPCLYLAHLSGLSPELLILNSRKSFPTPSLLGSHRLLRHP